MTVKQTLADLVAINSVSSNSNAHVIDYLARRCSALGFELVRHSYLDEAGVEKINLIALSNRAQVNPPKVELALVGHTDTVPFDLNWREALTLEERDEKLYGRGACDTKAFIAATLTAIESLDLNELRSPLALVFTADEEVGLIGAKRLSEARAIEARYAIVGEPTSLRPMRAGKGYCLAQVTVKGREAHSAYPGLGASAISGAARLLTELEQLAVDLEAKTHDAFDPPFTTLNVGLINGGTAKNVIPGECRFTLEWRPVPGQDPNHLLKLLEVAIDKQRSLNSDLDFDVNASRTDDGFETAANSRLVRLLEEISTLESGTVAFGTEAAQLTELGAEAVVMGPGNIRVAHRSGEFVPTVELERCVEILKTAMERLCF